MQGSSVYKTASRDWELDLRLTSALFDRICQLKKWLHIKAMRIKASFLTASINSQDHSEKIIRYEDLVAEHGTDLSGVLPKRMLVDTIPYDLETAIRRYQPTLLCLRYIKSQTESRKIEMLLTSYPYSWMVSTKENLALSTSSLQRDI